MRLADEDPEPAKSFSERLNDGKAKRGLFQKEQKPTAKFEPENESAEASAPAPGRRGEVATEKPSPSKGGAEPDAPTPRRSYSRESVQRELAEAPRKRESRKPAIRVVAAVVIALVLVGAGVAFAYMGGLSSNLRSGIDDNLRDVLVETDMANEPFYMLLLGTDGSYERDADGSFGGAYRSDSIMLARIDVPQRKVTLVSVPRDIPVDLGGDIGEQKINAAYTYGGPAMAVSAVSKLAGVDISHYAQVDFDGFSSMVDALGGVEVNVPVYIDDPDAGGVLQAGEQTLNGEQALILCRSRETYGTSGDLMRAANQRLVLSAIAKKLLDSDVGTIAYTTQVMSEYASTDLGLTDIIGLAQAMRGIDPTTDIYTASVPTTSQYVNGGWYEYVDKEAWAKMMERVDAGLPPTEETVVDEETGTVISTAGTAANNVGAKYCTVTVKNGTDTTGLAAGLRSKLMDAGYVNVVIGEVNDNFDYPETLVVYNEPNRQNEAQQILDSVGQGKLYLDDDMQYSLIYTDFLVIIGEDWQQ